MRHGRLGRTSPFLLTVRATSVGVWPGTARPSWHARLVLLADLAMTSGRGIGLAFMLAAATPPANHPITEAEIQTEIRQPNLR